MLIVRPDFDRRIDLPGAGPCPRPVDIDGTKADLKQLVSLRVYSFAAGTAIDGEAEGDEVFIVLMRGAADFAVTAAGERQTFALREDGERVFYMPPGSAYRLDAIGDCDIAYARCMPRGTTPGPRGFAPAGGRLDIADHATGMALGLAIATARGALAGSAGSAERFVHVRSRGGAVRLSGERLGDWESAIVAAGEAATVEVEGEEVDILTIGATPA